MGRLITSILLLILLLGTTQPLHASGIKDKLQTAVNNFEVSDEIKVFLIAMIPIFELRGAIPIGVLSYKLPLWEVVPLALAGNMVPIFLILLLFDWVTRICYKVPFLRRMLEALFRRTRSKSAVIEKYEEIGLMLFVAIPLPVTGAWTGSLAAYLMGLNFWKSIFFIFLGVCIAAVVVSILTLLGWIGAAIALVALTFVVIQGMRKKDTNEVT